MLADVRPQRMNRRTRRPDVVRGAGLCIRARAAACAR